MDNVWVRYHERTTTVLVKSSSPNIIIMNPENVASIRIYTKDTEPFIFSQHFPRIEELHISAHTTDISHILAEPTLKDICIEIYVDGWYIHQRRDVPAEREHYRIFADFCDLQDAREHEDFFCSEAKYVRFNAANKCSTSSCLIKHDDQGQIIWFDARVPHKTDIVQLTEDEFETLHGDLWEFIGTRDPRRVKRVN